jgi:hypothetical protein
MRASPSARQQPQLRHVVKVRFLGARWTLACAVLFAKRQRRTAIAVFPLVGSGSKVGARACTVDVRFEFPSGHDLDVLIPLVMPPAVTLGLDIGVAGRGQNRRTPVEDTDLAPAVEGEPSR